MKNDLEGSLPESEIIQHCTPFIYGEDFMTWMSENEKFFYEIIKPLEQFMLVLESETASPSDMNTAMEKVLSCDQYQQQIRVKEDNDLLGKLKDLKDRTTKIQIEDILITLRIELIAASGVECL